MSDANIQASIDALRTELAKLGGGDEVVRARLDALIVDLERRLADPVPNPELDTSVEDMIKQFEVEHPRITGVLNDLMVTLSGMGI